MQLFTRILISSHQEQKGLTRRSQFTKDLRLHLCNLFILFYKVIFTRSSFKSSLPFLHTFYTVIFTVYQGWIHVCVCVWGGGLGG